MQNPSLPYSPRSPWPTEAALKNTRKHGVDRSVGSFKKGSTFSVLGSYESTLKNLGITKLTHRGTGTGAISELKSKLAYAYKEATILFVVEATTKIPSTSCLQTLHEGLKVIAAQPNAPHVLALCCADTTYAHSGHPLLHEGELYREGTRELFDNLSTMGVITIPIVFKDREKILEHALACIVRGEHPYPLKTGYTPQSNLPL